MSTEHTWAEGRYTGRAHPQISAKTTEKGIRLAVTLDILNEGFEERTLTCFLNLGVSDASDDFAIRSLRDMGWTATSFDDPSGLGSVEVDVVVKHRMHEGKQQLDVTVWKPRSGSFTFDTPADAASLGAMTARLKGKLVTTVPKKAPPFRAPASAPAPAAWDGTGVDPNGT